MTPGRRLVTLAAATAAIDLLAALILGSLTLGHDLVRDYISTIGVDGAPHARLYQLIGSLTTVLHLVILWAVMRRTDGLRGDRVAFALTGLFYVYLWFGAVLYPCDPGCVQVSQTAQVHYALGIGAFISAGLAAIIWSVVLWREGHGRDQWPVHGVAAATAVLFLVLLGLDLTDNPVRGIVERVALLAWSTWTVLLVASALQVDAHVRA